MNLENMVSIILEHISSILKEEDNIEYITGTFNDELELRIINKECDIIFDLYSLNKYAVLKSFISLNEIKNVSREWCILNNKVLNFINENYGSLMYELVSKRKVK